MIKQNARISAKNPCPNAAPAPTEAPLLSDLIRLGTVPRPKITFHGWSRGLGWEGWVREMMRREDVVRMWRKAGIENSILGSITHFYPDHHALEALVGFWSPTSRTFIFPWGEAAFTLEDAHILSNLPIRGSKLDRELTDEENELSERLYVEREKIRMLHLKAKLGRKVTIDIWLDWFLDLRGEDELKFLGFLTYWLAKNVIPVNSSGEVPKVVFRLAARLSCGDRIALAPVVTANIFNDLTRITNLAFNVNGKKKGSNNVTIWTPFWLIQAWIWERFESLRPVIPDTIMLISRSRISRWSNRKRKSSYDEAIHIYWEERSYTWRPYSKNSANWIEPCWYHLESRTVCISEDTPHWMDDFLTVISPSIIQGFYGDHVISSERYQPYRVARQFGYDQGIPFSRDPLASLWIESNACLVGDKMHIPEITRFGNPRGEYLAWWQKCRSQYQNGLLAYAVPADNKNTYIHQTEERDDYPPFPVPTTLESFETPKPMIKCEGKNNKENSVLLEEKRSDQKKDRNKGNDQCLNATQKDKGKGYDRIITKPFIDRMDLMGQTSGRERKLEDEQTVTRRKDSVLLEEQRSDQRKECNKGNDQILNSSQKDKEQGYDIITSKSVMDRIDWMEQTSGMVRKLQDEQTATKREKSVLLEEQRPDQIVECNKGNDQCLSSSQKDKGKGYANIISSSLVDSIDWMEQTSGRERKSQGEQTVARRENSVLLEEQRSDKRKECKRGNDQCLNGSQNNKGKGYGSIISKSSVDRTDWMEQTSERKRKLEDEQTATMREKSAALGEEITVTVIDIEGFVDCEEKDRRLVKELEVFERRGLLSEWVPGSPKFEMEDNSRLHYNGAISINEAPYGQEAIRMYPKFFELIPQRPHYTGLLDKKVSENIRLDVYSSKWYKLVDLMRRTLETSCQTPASEFGKLMQEAERYKELGFNVKHIIARLKEPQTRLRRLEDARLRLEEARKKENQAREVQTLKRHINDLGSKLKVIEEKLESSQGAFGMDQQENTLDIMALRKEVEAAETNLSVVERDVQAMSISY